MWKTMAKVWDGLSNGGHGGELGVSTSLMPSQQQGKKNASLESATVHPIMLCASSM